MFLFVGDMHIIDPLGFVTGFLIFACLLWDVLRGACSLSLVCSMSLTRSIWLARDHYNCPWDLLN